MSLRFARVFDPRHGPIPVAVQGGDVIPISELAPDGLIGLIRDRRLNDPGFLESIDDLLQRQERYPLRWASLLDAPWQRDVPHVMLPYEPPEVWGVGVSYRRVAQLHEEDLAAAGRATGLYDYVYASERPEIFFKGLARHCVGPRESLGIRGDSRGTIIEAELACVYDRDGRIVAYTLANDVTAWDLEKESPLFLTYAKVFLGSCAIGPCLVPAQDIDPTALELQCRVERSGRTLYEGTGATAQMKRSLEELSRYLVYANPVADGAILCTGTAVGIPNDVVVEDGDEITIQCEAIGVLRNTARRLPAMNNPQLEVGHDSSAVDRSSRQHRLS